MRKALVAIGVIALVIGVFLTFRGLSEMQRLNSVYPFLAFADEPTISKWQSEYLRAESLMTIGALLSIVGFICVIVGALRK